MSTASTEKLIDSYLDEASAPRFLSSFFKSPPKNFHDQESVTLDIMRDDEDVAIVVTDLSTGARNNESTKYTSKGWTPPILWEKGSIQSFTKMQRQMGRTPFEDPRFVADAIEESFRMYRKLENKLRRTVEQMAAQVFSTGQLTMTDAAGTTLFGLDFSPKADHMKTVSTTWAADGATGDPLADLASLAQVVRRNGKKNPDILVMGKTAFTRFLKFASVKELFNKEGFNLAGFNPVARGEDATFQGFINIGNYKFEIWTYEGFYRDPVTGNHTPYVADEHVLMLSSKGRLDLTFGAIPRIVAPDPRVASFMPGRIASASAGIDINPWAYVSPDGTNVTIEVGTRPLTIPTAIDTFARLDITA